MKTFYIETFGCQMNAHDSEKVVGTLLHQGYRKVETPEEAELVFYNTCSIRDKAEQKVFNRLNQFKREHGKGKTFAVLGCVAQQEGEKIFEKAPHVSLVCGSASYNQLPEMLVQLETGNRRVTGLSLDTEDTFETPVTRRDNPHRAYLTIIEGCDKSCAYCVVPFTRGPERSRTSASVLAETLELARAGYTEIQLLGQNVNSYRDPSPAGWDFATLLDQVGKVPGIRRVRFTTSHPRDFKKSIVDAIEANTALCNHVHLPVQSGSTRVLAAMQRLYTREEYMERIGWMKASRRPIAITYRYHRRVPGRDRGRPGGYARVCWTKCSTIRFSVSSTPGGRIPRPCGWTIRLPKKRRPGGWRSCRNISATSRSAAMPSMSESMEECMVEGFNKATSQWIGRTSQHKTLNFLRPGSDEDLAGKYIEVRVTRAGPNSLVGEAVN